MSIISKYNKGNLFTHRTNGNEAYITLKELYQELGEKEPVQVLNFFINTKSKFGDYPIAVTQRFLVNLPKHLLATVQEMLQDEEIASLANSGKLCFVIYQYTGKNGDGYSVNWVELGD